MALRDAPSRHPTREPEALVEIDATANKLSQVWVEISEHRAKLAIATRQFLVESEGGLAARAFATAVDTRLEKMDDLIFSSVEAIDDLIQLMQRQARAHATKKAEADRPTKNLANATTQTIPPRENGPPLSKMPPTIELFQLMSKNMDAQATDPDRTASFTTPRASAKAFKRPRSPDTHVHQVKRSHHAKASIATPARSLTTESKQSYTTHESHQLAPSRSPTSESSDSKPKAKRFRRPSHLRRKLATLVALRISDVRMRGTQKEYCVHFDGYDEPQWMTTKEMSPSTKPLVDEFKLKRRVESGESAAKRSKKKTYTVDKIIKHRITKKGLKEYWVKWEDFGSDYNTWEPELRLRADVPDVVRDYERMLARRAREPTAKTTTDVATSSLLELLDKTPEQSDFSLGWSANSPSPLKLSNAESKRQPPPATEIVAVDDSEDEDSQDNDSASSSEVEFRTKRDEGTTSSRLQHFFSKLSGKS